MIHNSKIRNGNFSSSEIVALTTEGKKAGTFGAPALNYIEEKNMERRLGRSVDQESNAKPLVWGKTIEKRVFNILSLDYILTSQETDSHPTIPYWVGSKDGMKFDTGRTVIDIKSPITLKSFCQLVQPLYDGLEGMEAMSAIRNGYVDKNGVSHSKHKDGEKFFYQLVSNAIINDCKFAELIIYVPYESEIPEIKLEVDGLPNCYWIALAADGELPFIKDEGYYKNINIIRFEVSEEDKNFLTEKVLQAGKLLINNPSTLLAEHKVFK